MPVKEVGLYWPEGLRVATDGFRRLPAASGGAWLPVASGASHGLANSPYLIWPCTTVVQHLLAMATSYSVEVLSQDSRQVKCNTELRDTVVITFEVTKQQAQTAIVDSGVQWAPTSSNLLEWSAVGHPVSGSALGHWSKVKRLPPLTPWLMQKKFRSKIKAARYVATFLPNQQPGSSSGTQPEAPAARPPQAAPAASASPAAPASARQAAPAASASPAAPASAPQAAPASPAAPAPAAASARGRGRRDRQATPPAERLSPAVEDAEEDVHIPPAKPSPVFDKVPLFQPALVVSQFDEDIAALTRRLSGADKLRNVLPLWSLPLEYRRRPETCMWYFDLLSLEEAKEFRHTEAARARVIKQLRGELHPDKVRPLPAARCTAGSNSVVV